MKQGTIKTLGVAALGAAFAATAAGTAAAAGPVETVAPTVAGAVQALPAETLGQFVPGGAQALPAAQGAVGTISTTVPPVADQALETTADRGAAELAGGLPATRQTLGSVPAGAIAKTVPGTVGSAAMGAVPAAGLLGGLPV
ncbi:ATP-binding protein [Streptomyces sp. NPDC050610]|uniref:ATP-binding protein n=1 Tax=Streptomyces sp. NPDC050610 TaxID=3157097 RepID=UPI00343CE2FF